MPPLSTFSIVAFDPAAQEWGVATQSKFLAVGAVVPWARAGAGAVATQSYANTTFGPEGLALMAAGLSAPLALEKLLAADDGRATRQVGLVDARGEAATFTGRECLPWAGGITGSHFAAQGNILVSQDTVAALAETFAAARGALADRLVRALQAGQTAGGDRRGQQSAAVLVVKDKGGYAGFNDRYLDLRVDDHPHPIVRLRELLDLHALYFQKPEPKTLLPIDAALARELSRIARQAGYYSGPLTDEYDPALKKAIEDVVGRENLEERWQPDARIDPVVLNYLRHAYPARRSRPAAKKRGRQPAARRR